MPYHFYILYSVQRDKFYIGHTGGAMEERLRRHNSRHKGYTGGPGDWVIMYTEPYENKKLAYAREREVKGWKSSTRIEALIQKAAQLV